MLFAAATAEKNRKRSNPMKTRLVKTRLLTALLMLCMLLPQVPMLAFAAENEGSVTNPSGGSNVEVNTTVRDNYTDIKTYETVRTYVNGTVTVDGDSSDLNGSTLTFIDRGALTVQAVYDSASNKTTLTLDITNIPKGVYYTDYKENKSRMTTTYDGFKLTYAGSVTNPATGKEIINEIRDDYYTRNHVYERECLTIQAAEPTESVGNVESHDQPGDVHTHSFSWVTVTEPSVGVDGLEEYRCSCGLVEQSQVIPGSQFYVKDMFGNIKDAPVNGTVEYDAGTWHTISDYVLKKMSERPDAAVTVKFIYKGKTYQIIFPAGTDYTAVLNDEDMMYGYFGVAEKLGLTVTELD